MNAPIRWASRTSFIFATAAAAIGLGNIWRFPYLAGQYGGGAFVIIYVFFVVVLGFPLMLSEVFLGRTGRGNPMKTITNVAKRVQRSRRWGLIGGVSILAAFLILSYYLVIAGWVFDYFFRAILGQFKQVTEISAINSFKTLQADYWEMFLTDTLLTLAMIGVIALGVKRGLERTVMILFPALLLLMIVLLIYSVTSGGFHQAVVFLFEPNFHQVTPKVVLMALGQAFFSLNIAMAINIMFSAYLPEDTPVSTSVMAVCFADTAIALLAG